MEQSHILLILLFIILVTNQRFFISNRFNVANLICFQIPFSVKCQEMNSYVSEDGELITDPASPPEPDVSNVVASNDTCLKVKTIVYYENYFRDGWVGQGNDPITR